MIKTIKVKDNYFITLIFKKYIITKKSLPIVVIVVVLGAGLEPAQALLPTGF